MLVWFMFLLYIALSAYVLWRMIHWLKRVVPLFKHKRMQAVLILLYLLCASTMILGGLLPKSDFQVFLHKLGNYWLGIFIYIVFNILVSDIIVLILKFVNKRRKINLLGSLKGYYIIGIIVISVSVFFCTYGFIHAQSITKTSYDITVDKSIDGTDSLKIALLADFHLGYNVGSKKMEQMVEQVNNMNADLVVIAGDIFDNNYDALDNPDELIAILQGINSRLGTYVVYGNHDVTETLIGGFSITSRTLAFRDERMNEFLEKCGFTVLTDDIVTLDNGNIYLIGRLDREKAGDGTSDRMSINKLMENVDKSKVIIDLEHEPANLDGIANSGVDIMLCGHTHAGQFFPLTIVQPLAWQNYHGYLKVGNMHNFVTSGVGLYGPNMRVFTDSEVMEINVNFKN
jgi:predicted MPP superfamily phosphohydrolase